MLAVPKQVASTKPVIGKYIISNHVLSGKSIDTKELEADRTERALNMEEKRVSVAILAYTTDAQCF